MQRCPYRGDPGVLGIGVGKREIGNTLGMARQVHSSVLTEIDDCGPKVNPLGGRIRNRPQHLQRSTRRFRNALSPYELYDYPTQC